MTPYDVIVVGMGPSGAVTAAELGRAGLSVLGLEWKPIPRYKVCGGGLSARIDRVLVSDFHQVIERTIHRVRFQFAGSESFTITSTAPIAYMVMRDQFDAHLVQKAGAAGVQVRDDERVLELSEGPDGVEVKTARGQYRAGIVVGADGAGSLVARTLFSGRRGRLWSAIEGEVPVSEIPSCLGTDTIALDIGMAAGGYAWVFPKRERLSVGIAEFQGATRHPKRSYERFLQDEPSLTGLPLPRGLGHPIPLYGGPSAENLPLTTARSILVGDAAHLVDPVLGEGIYYGVLSGQMAAEAIINHQRGLSPDLRTYDAQVARELYPEFRVASRMARSLYRFPHISHRVMRRRPEMLDLYADVLKGHETYRSFYTKGKAWAKESFADLLKDACVATFKS